LLEVHELTIRYADRVAVREASLSLQGGKVTALIGPNGAGKSTLLRALNGQLKPAGGSILLNKESLERFSRRAIARQITVVAQESELRFPVTVIEFVLGGRFVWANNSGWKT